MSVPSVPPHKPARAHAHTRTWFGASTVARPPGGAGARSVTGRYPLPYLSRIATTPSPLSSPSPSPSPSARPCPRPPPRPPPPPPSRICGDQAPWACHTLRWLQVSFDALGERLLASGRFTKATQHLRQGTQLFASVGLPVAAAWQEWRLAHVLLTPHRSLAHPNFWGLLLAGSSSSGGGGGGGGGPDLGPGGVREAYEAAARSLALLDSALARLRPFTGGDANSGDASSGSSGSSNRSSSVGGGGDGGASGDGPGTGALLAAVRRAHGAACTIAATVASRTACAGVGLLDAVAAAGGAWDPAGASPWLPLLPLVPGGVGAAPPSAPPQPVARRVAWVEVCVEAQARAAVELLHRAAGAHASVGDAVGSAVSLRALASHHTWHALRGAAGGAGGGAAATAAAAAAAAGNYRTLAHRAVAKALALLGEEAGPAGTGVGATAATEAGVDAVAGGAGDGGGVSAVVAPSTTGGAPLVAARLLRLALRADLARLHLADPGGGAEACVAAVLACEGDAAALRIPVAPGAQGGPGGAAGGEGARGSVPAPASAAATAVAVGPALEAGAGVEEAGDEVWRRLLDSLLQALKLLVKRDRPGDAKVRGGPVSAAS
jgi:hypothetical protein